MPVTIIVGGQWGDEGKGKITDTIAGTANMVVRPNGSTNAGHTVQSDQGTFKLHLIPSGILYPDCHCVIGAGVAVNPGELIREIQELKDRGIDMSRLVLSDRANVIFPYHPALDRLEETQRGSNEIGTTLRGNGPAYVDKAARRGIRVGDLLEEASLRDKLSVVLDEKNALLTKVYGAEPFDLNELLESYSAFGEQLRPFVVQSEVVVQDAIAAGDHIVVEAAQAALLDIDYGTYPYVTSTSPTAAGVCQGAGVGPTQVTNVMSVFKAYTTRVGAGPFPTEAKNAQGDALRELGAEFGTSTGRPRRTGWFDGPAARYTTRLNGVTQVALTKLDVLDTLSEIPVCVGYRLDGHDIPAPPATAAVYDRVEAIYEVLPGWQSDTSAINSFDQLPAEAQSYIARLEQLIGAPVIMVGIGPARQQILQRDPSAQPEISASR